MHGNTPRKTHKRLSTGLAALLFALFAQPAVATVYTWNFAGTLTGNTVDTNPIVVDGVPGTTANLTAAGVVSGSAISGTISFDDATGDYLTLIGQPDPNTGLYLTGGLNWTIGGLSARTAHANQSIVVGLNVNVATPPDPDLFLDLLIITGGSPPSWNGTANNIEVRTVAPDPNIPGDLGTAPSIALAMFPGTFPNNSMITTPPGFILDKGITVPLLDTGTGQVIQLNGAITTITGGGSAPACGSGDTDSDTICDDVDRCVNDFDITQADTDGNGNGDACNNAFDTDGDEWEDGLDNCPNVYNPTNACSPNQLPVLGGAGYVLLIGLLGLGSVVMLARQRGFA